MTPAEVKERLNALVDVLPEDQARLLVEIASVLEQHAWPEAHLPDAPPAQDELDDWDREIVAAEEYWFGLPGVTRRNYAGKLVAVARDGILDADADEDALADRIETKYPNRPVLYIEAEAERLPPLVIRSPRFL